MTKEKNFIRARYDSNNMKVIGYYANNINYNNNIIDDEKQTIDGDPYLKITEQQHTKCLGKQMSVNGDVLVEYVEEETVEQKKSRIKKELILPRQLFLNKSKEDAIEFLLETQEYPNKEKREKVKREIEQIQSVNTIKALLEFDKEFK